MGTAAAPVRQSLADAASARRPGGCAAHGWPGAGTRPGGEQSDTRVARREGRHTVGKGDTPGHPSGERGVAPAWIGGTGTGLAEGGVLDVVLLRWRTGTQPRAG